MGDAGLERSPAAASSSPPPTEAEDLEHTSSFSAASGHIACRIATSQGPHWEPTLGIYNLPIRSQSKARNAPPSPCGTPLPRQTVSEVGDLRAYIAGEFAQIRLLAEKSAADIAEIKTELSKVTQEFVKVSRRSSDHPEQAIRDTTAVPGMWNVSLVKAGAGSNLVAQTFNNSTPRKKGDSAQVAHTHAETACEDDWRLETLSPDLAGVKLECSGDEKRLLNQMTALMKDVEKHGRKNLACLRQLAETLARVNSQPEVDLKPVLDEIALLGDRMTVWSESMPGHMVQALPRLDLSPVLDAIARLGDRKFDWSADDWRQIAGALPKPDLNPVLDAIAQLRHQQTVCTENDINKIAQAVPKPDLKPVLDAIAQLGDRNVGWSENGMRHIMQAVPKLDLEPVLDAIAHLKDRRLTLTNDDKIHIGQSVPAPDFTPVLDAIAKLGYQSFTWTEEYSRRIAEAIPQLDHKEILDAIMVLSERKLVCEGCRGRRHRGEDHGKANGTKSSIAAIQSRGNVVWDDLRDRATLVDSLEFESRSYSRERKEAPTAVFVDRGSVEAVLGDIANLFRLHKVPMTVVYNYVCQERCDEEHQAWISEIMSNRAKTVMAELVRFGVPSDYMQLKTAPTDQEGAEAMHFEFHLKTSR